MFSRAPAETRVYCTMCMMPHIHVYVFYIAACSATASTSCLSRLRAWKTVKRTYRTGFEQRRNERRKDAKMRINGATKSALQEKDREEEEDATTSWSHAVQQSPHWEEIWVSEWLLRIINISRWMLSDVQERDTDRSRPSFCVFYSQPYIYWSHCFPPAYPLLLFLSLLPLQLFSKQFLRRDV